MLKKGYYILLIASVLYLISMLSCGPSEEELFQQAVVENTTDGYAKYLDRYPKGKFVREANESYNKLQRKKAVVEIDFPDSVVVQGTTVPHWSWKTNFREKGGEIGFWILAHGRIIDPQGRTWNAKEAYNEVGRGMIVVPAGGTGGNDYGLRSPTHALCNGYAVFNWKGEDAGGHTIEFQERVLLRHVDCPGPKLSTQQ
jgi:hypothetical protein